MPTSWTALGSSVEVGVLVAGSPLPEEPEAEPGEPLGVPEGSPPGEFMAEAPGDGELPGLLAEPGDEGLWSELLEELLGELGGWA